MGTRNLTMVVSNSETRIAQYGQWDGYPSGQGITALEFLRGVNIADFKKRVDELNWLSQDDENRIDETPNWATVYPYLSRDMAAGILEYVMNKDVVGLMNKELFAGDGLFCEWGYVVDLDKNTFEVYKGFGHSVLDKSERFAHLGGKKTSDDTYYSPIKHVRTWKLDELPTNDDFIKELEGSDDEDE
jgi:hypothetical protein